MAFDIYAAVTDRIIQQMEDGVLPWSKPWGGVNGGAYSGTTGKPYSLLNQMLLNKPGAYYTFNQVQKLGGSVRKGEKSQMVVFWKQIPVKEQNSQTGEIQENLIPMLRYYNVFHIDQCEDLKDKHTQTLPNSVNPDKTADRIITDYCSREGVTLTHEAGDRAFYRPSTDSITLPHMAQFALTDEYYSTAFHELTHSTGHSKRLNRLDKTAFFGSEAYSKEELIAEIGASALVNLVGLETSNSFRNNTAYIQNWLSVLRNDKRFIVSASGKAEKAVNLILGMAG